MTGIGRQLGAELPAQQLVKGLVNTSGLQIPNGGVQGTDGGIHDTARVLCPKGMLIKIGPDGVAFPGATADNAGRQLFQNTDDPSGAGTIGKPGFTPAALTGRRLDHHHYWVPNWRELPPI